MISGAFHAMSQEWRYFSREKSIIHTLHLGQLPPSRPGETILIDSTAPATNGGPFSVPPITPITFGGVNGATVNVTIATNTLSTVYASIGPNRTELAKSKCIIQYGVWDDNLKEILITPQESGWFLIHGEYTSGLQNNLVSNGGSYATGDLWYDFSNKFTGKIDRQPIGFQGTQVAAFGRPFYTVNGNYTYNFGGATPNPPTPPDTPWNPNFYIASITSDGITQIYEGIAGRYFRIALTNQSNPINVTSDLTAWLVKIGEFGQVP